MIPGQDVKWMPAVLPVSIKDNASWTATEIDTAGFNYCTIAVMLGATDIAMSALTLTESNTSGSGFGNVTGAIWGTSTDIAAATSTLPSATNDNKIFLFQIDLRLRKRYLKLTATAGDGTAGTYLCSIAMLSRAAAGPTTAAEMGAIQVLRV